MITETSHILDYPFCILKKRKPMFSPVYCKHIPRTVVEETQKRLWTYVYYSNKLELSTDLRSLPVYNRNISKHNSRKNFTWYQTQLFELRSKSLLQPYKVRQIDGIYACFRLFSIMKFPIGDEGEQNPHRFKGSAFSIPTTCAYCKVCQLHPMKITDPVTE